MRDSWDEFEKIKKTFCNTRFATLTNNNPTEYARFMTDNCDEIKNVFSERNLCETVADDSECKDLITHAILENEKAVYSIVTRDTEQVIGNLNVGTNPKMETESVYQTRYKFWHTNLNLHKDDDQVFGEEDKHKIFTEPRKNQNVFPADALINDPNE